MFQTINEHSILFIIHSFCFIVAFLESKLDSFSEKALFSLNTKFHFFCSSYMRYSILFTIFLIGFVSSIAISSRGQGSKWFENSEGSILTEQFKSVDKVHKLSQGLNLIDVSLLDLLLILTRNSKNSDFDVKIQLFFSNLSFVLI
jgi:hypothetical protein